MKPEYEPVTSPGLLRVLLLALAVELAVGGIVALAVWFILTR